MVKATLIRQEHTKKKTYTLTLRQRKIFKKEEEEEKEEPKNNK